MSILVAAYFSKSSPYAAPQSVFGACSAGFLPHITERTAPEQGCKILSSLVCPRGVAQFPARKREKVCEAEQCKHNHPFRGRASICTGRTACARISVARGPFRRRFPARRRPVGDRVPVVPRSVRRFKAIAPYWASAGRRAAECPRICRGVLARHSARRPR